MMPQMYFGSMDNPKMKEMCNSNPAIVNRGRDIPFSTRSLPNKIARLIYRFFRLIYVSVIFYFTPFGVLFLTYYYASI